MLSPVGMTLSLLDADLVGVLLAYFLFGITATLALRYFASCERTRHSDDRTD